MKQHLTNPYKIWHSCTNHHWKKGLKDIRIHCSTTVVAQIHEGKLQAELPSYEKGNGGSMERGGPLANRREVSCCREQKWEKNNRLLLLK